MQRNSVSTEVFADKNNPLESISADAIHQGALGNCYLQAALAGVATQKPELIRDMIQDVGHGVYKVTFPGDKENPVYVNAPSDLNIGIFIRAARTEPGRTFLRKPMDVTNNSKTAQWKRPEVMQKELMVEASRKT